MNQNNNKAILTKVGKVKKIRMALMKSILIPKTKFILIRRLPRKNLGYLEHDPISINIRNFSWTKFGSNANRQSDEDEIQLYSERRLLGYSKNQVSCTSL